MHFVIALSLRLHEDASQNKDAVMPNGICLRNKVVFGKSANKEKRNGITAGKNRISVKLCV